MEDGRHDKPECRDVNLEVELFNHRNLDTVSQGTGNEGRRMHTIEGTALSLESIDDVERCDSLSLGAGEDISTRPEDVVGGYSLLSVCDGITDDTLKEGLQDTTGLFVDHG